MFLHQLQFYDSDAFLVQTVLDFVAAALRAGDGAIVIATREHLNALQEVLGARDRGHNDKADHVVLLDAEEALAMFMVDGRPDPDRFTEVFGGLILQVSDHGSRHVSAFGEMVAVLHASGNTDAAIELERLWADLAQHQRFSVLCAYPSKDFMESRHSAAFQCICAAHAEVRPIERLQGPGAEPKALHRTIAILQQQADALQRELRRRDDEHRLLESQGARIAALLSMQAELEVLASRDALTGLANRRAFARCLSQAVERATQVGSPLALIYVDLDGFKRLNDRHGHCVGDTLLQHVAARLRQSVRALDTVCRWGGDEFAIIAEDADAARAQMLMQRIVTNLTQDFCVGTDVIHLTASVGYSRFPDDATDANALVDRADAAMYLAKRSARSRRGGEVLTGAPAATAAPTHPIRRRVNADQASDFLTVEAAATRLMLSRPHVLKLIAEQRLHDVLREDSGALLIPVSEVGRYAQDMCE